MLRKLNKGESWSVKEMKEEQLCFRTDDGIVPVVHHGTDIPYYANELAARIYSGELLQLKKFKEQQHGRNSVLSDERKKRILDLKHVGYSNRAIAKELSISEGTVRNFLKNI